MITYETRTGSVGVSQEYLSKLIGSAVSTCYGVADMVPHRRQKLMDVFRKVTYIDKGIRVKGDINSITVDLHIAVLYGININTIASSITEAVKYTVQRATDITVKKVIVRIDGIVTE